ncbi:MAG: antibiotic biosynthesis monooxygenase, partial [Chitinophagaceae bacterium]|nr:antibiotic biosynthesis monooxygenase [Chitinophagaceae bacterium]
MIRIVRLSFQPEHTNDFTALFEARKLNIRAVAGCTHLELWRDQEQGNVFYTYSHWEHPDDLEKYRVSEFFKDTW